MGKQGGNLWMRTRTELLPLTKRSPKVGYSIPICASRTASGAVLELMCMNVRYRSERLIFRCGYKEEGSSETQDKLYRIYRFIHDETILMRLKGTQINLHATLRDMRPLE